MQAKGGGTAGHVHIIGEAINAKGGLNFDRNRRISSLKVGARYDHRIHIAGFLSGLSQCFIAGSNRHITLNGRLIVAAFRDIRRHAFRINNAGLVNNMPALDT